MLAPMRFAFVLLLLASAASAADVRLAFELRWRGAPLAVPSAPVRNDSGQTLRLTRFAALVSGVTLVRFEGSAVQLDGQYGFIDAETGRLTVTLRNVPAGDYTGLAFQLGVPAAANHADPSQWPAAHPLNPIVNGLHWGWQGGYVFAALEGRWRANDTAEERGFSYHLATDAHLMKLRFVSPFSVQGDTTIGLALDLGKVFGPRSLAAGDGSETTHSGKDDALAATLAQALERAGFFLEARPTPAASPVGDSGRKNPPTKGTATGAMPYAFNVPVGFPQPELPGDNPLTVEGIALGESLFNDRRLSKNNRQSCANCHRERLAFTDGGAFSTGVDRVQGTRSSMPLFNLAWQPAYAWDGTQSHIRDQSIKAMTSEIEMHGDPATIVATLEKDAALRAKFAAAFGSPEISVARIGLALEQYLLTIVSGDSKFDRATRSLTTLTEEEQRGFTLFATEYDPARGRYGADCFHCHGDALFSDYSYKNNGLDRTFLDEGRALATGRETDRGKFKTPSLRNVELTAPYMHDGRFGLLEDVVAHYDHAIRRSATLDPNIAKHPDEGLKLSDADQHALVAFLKTLTEEKWKRK